MSLALVANYSSDEEEEQRLVDDSDTENSQDDPEVNPLSRLGNSNTVQQPKTSLLPSPDEIFSEVTGPPEFLKSEATKPVPCRPQDNWQPAYDASRAGSKYSNGPHSVTDSPRIPPPGAVVEAKALLIGDHEWSRNDNGDTINGVKTTRKVPGVDMPPPEDAAALLRICLKCGVPKTYSGAKESMVCPLCNDRPTAGEEKTETEKRSGSKIKDKEKNKRMKGQSSHATWKSETEMQLRQHFD